MAYRRRQVISRASTFNDEIHRSSNDDNTTTSSSAAPSSSLAAKAIRASAAHRDSSLSSAYANSALHSSFKDRSKDSATYDYTSMGSTNEPGGFWGVLARKAKSIIDDDGAPRRFDTSSSVKPETVITSNQVEHRYESFENSRKLDSPKLKKGLDRLTTSLNQIGGSIGNAFEEGRTIVDKKTQDIIQETRKLQSRRKGTNDEPATQSKEQQTNQENQIKASRDVRWRLQRLLRQNYSFGS